MSQIARWWGVVALCGAAISAAQNGALAIEQYNGTASQRVQAAADVWSAKLGGVRSPGPLNSRQTPQGEYAGINEAYRNDAQHIHAFIALGEGSSVCHVQVSVGPGTGAEIKALLSRCIPQLRSGASTSATAPATVPGNIATQNGAASHNTTAAARTPAVNGAEPPTASAMAPPAHAANWSLVKGVYFQVAYTGGVGGAIYPTFEPLILFNDGTAYEIGKAALEDIDLPSEKQRRPAEWSHWQSSGNGFVFTDAKGHRDSYKLQDGRFFVAYSAEKGGMLGGKYEHVGGGGNTAVGGGLSILSQSKIAFARDGHFVSGSANVVSGPSIGGGGSRGMRAPGTYKLSHYTLELHYPDGHSERTFFAYSSSGNDGHLSRDMIFIGDTGFTTE